MRIGNAFHPTEWRFDQFNRFGEKIWEQDWTPNALADEGESAMLDVYFRNAAGPTQFYIGLCNDTLVDTDGLTDILGEPSTNGYARVNQLIERSNTGFPTLELDAGDYRVVSSTETITASGGSIGPVTTAFLATTSDNTGLLIVYNALSQSRTLSDGDSLQVTMRIKLA